MRSTGRCSWFKLNKFQIRPAICEMGSEQIPLLNENPDRRKRVGRSTMLRLKEIWMRNRKIYSASRGLQGIKTTSLAKIYREGQDPTTGL